MTRRTIASNQPSDAQVLFAAGLYGRALDALDRVRSQRKLSIDEHVLHAELLSATGAITNAISLATELLKLRSLSVSHQCALHGVLGMSCFRNGRHREGQEHFEQGIRLAESSSATYEGCHLRVNLFVCQIRWIGPYQAAAAVDGLRRRVHHVGDPTLSIRFQLGLLELATRLGLYRRARRHLNTARELLATSQNRTLAAEIEQAEVGLTADEGDLGRALELTVKFVKTAEATGSHSALWVAWNNLAHLLSAQGRYDEALQWIHKALDSQRHRGGNEIVLRGTLMQLFVAKGDFHEAEAEAERIGILLDNSLDPGSYWVLWHVLTRVKWLFRIGKIDQGLNEALDATQRTDAMANRRILERLQLFIAEGLARTGRVNEAADVLAQAVIANEDPSLETVAEMARIRGVILGKRDPIEAIKHFDHAAAIFNGIGHLAAEAEVRSEASQITAGQTSGGAVDDAERLTLSVDVGSHPRLLGMTILSFLEESGAVQHARLVVKLANESRELHKVGAGGEERSPLADGKRIQILLGKLDGEYSLEIKPLPTPSARMAVLAVEKLARVALAVDRARQNEKEQAAVWPEPVVEEALGVICSSERTSDLVKTIRRVAGSNLTILFTGETGVGKELFARALHLASPRKARAFLPFNCTGVPKDMFESQLFGHRRGAFTGAHETSPGVIRAAAGGTLFLDEIGEMSLDAQPKLLRFLESGEVHPIGEPKPHLVDVRVVAATNKDLEQLVADGRFREDLYYRLNVLPIRIPPLRERREEIPALVDHFLQKYGHEMQKPMLRVADETLEYLLLYRWPGNVRQLANELRRIVALAEPAETLLPVHLSPEIVASRRTVPANKSDMVIDLGQSLQDATNQLERAAIARALKAAHGNNDEAARALGLSRKGLYLKRQRLGLK
jgi:DNA-binding NtrC family response regulator/tetratricopeptide (TPR) repeat protein